MLDLLIMEYKEVRSDLSEIQRIPERWGTIMLPLSAGILAVAINSIESLPTIGITMLVFLSITTISIWRFIGYNSAYRTTMLVERLRSLEAKISKHQTTEEVFELKWERWLRYPKSFLPFLSQRALLDIFALLYITTGIAIIIMKITSF